MKLSDLTKKNDEEIFELADSLPVLQYKKFKELDFIEHCFTTREGGVSQGMFESMNLSFSRGDDPEAVFENYRRVATALHRDVEDFVCSDQTHTVNILKVDSSFAGKGVTQERDYRDIDGLITDVPKIVLSTFYADCVPLFFVDPVHRAIGLSHSGWRGTVGRIGARTIEAMQQAYGTQPKDVWVAIGPSICQDCYEISQDVADEFCKEFPNYQEDILIPKNHGKFQLDLWRCNELLLLEAGVTKEHLITTNVCTCCNHKYLFSHRATQGKRGNLGAFLSIKER